MGSFLAGGDSQEWADAQWVVDLTHPFSHDMPAWLGDPTVTLAPYKTLINDGYALWHVTLGDHSGTHLGVAAHMAGGAMTVEKMPVEHLVRPACVIDFRAMAEQYPDAALTVDDVLRWEVSHGLLPPQAVVLLATGWDRRWENAADYFNRDENGCMHYPGYSASAVKFLVEERGIVGLGTDTAGIDPGADGTFSANAALLSAGRFHLENLARLERLPATGAVLFIGALPLVGCGGAPARVLACMPASTRR